MSTHRKPKTVRKFAQSIDKVVIAGGTAVLRCIIAVYTKKPDISVPIKSTLNGLDSFLSISQMPKGVSAATLANDYAGAGNAAISTAEILVLKYPEIKEKLLKFKRSLYAK